MSLIRRLFASLFGQAASTEPAALPPADPPVIACNFIEATKAVPLGAAAFLASPNFGNANDRVSVCVRSRSGHWIEKYEAIWRIGCFRPKVLHPSDPRAGDKRLWRDDAPALAERLQRTSDSERLARGLTLVTADELQRRRRPPRPTGEMLTSK